MDAAGHVDWLKGGWRRKVKGRSESGFRAGRAAIWWGRWIERLGIAVAATPDILEHGRGDVVTIVAGNGRPEVAAVSLVDSREAILVDTGALFKAFNVLGDQTESVARLKDMLVVSGGDWFGEDGDGVVVGRLRANTSVRSAFRAVGWR